MANKNANPTEITMEYKIPETVIAIFNDLIQKHVDTYYIADFDQSEVIASIVAAGLITDDNLHQIIVDGWFEVEEIYGDLGWVVKYINSANEEISDEARFLFISIRADRMSHITKPVL